MMVEYWNSTEAAVDPSDYITLVDIRNTWIQTVSILSLDIDGK